MQKPNANEIIKLNPDKLFKADNRASGIAPIFYF